MTVYITQQPKPNRKNWIPDLTPAEQFGNIDFVYFADAKVHANIEESVKVAKKRLVNFDADKDYICWPTAGDPTANNIIIMVLNGWGIFSIKFLYWNRRKDEDGAPIFGKGFYTPMQITVEPDYED